MSVNLVSGNVATSVSTPALNTLGGPMGLTFAYNSQAPGRAGLLGSYYEGTSASGSPALTRLDPHLAFEWQETPGPPVESRPYTVRWSGDLTVPGPGTYSLSIAHHGQATIKVDNVQVFAHTGTTKGMLSSPITFTSGSLRKPIQVDLVTTTGPGGVLLGAFGPPGSPTAAGVVIPPSWLAAGKPPLPLGWSMAPSGYGSARVAEGSAILTDASGAAHAWRLNNGGMTPPAGEAGAMGWSGAGGPTLHSGSGVSYVFDPAGRLTSAVSAADDGAQTSPELSWSPATGRLDKVRDPVSGREIALRYAAVDGDASCSAGVLAGQLCDVSYWTTGLRTVLTYVAGGQLARIENPGGEKVDFGYTAGLLTRVRDALAADAVPALAPDDDATRTVVAYTGGKATRVVLPRPKPGEPQPGREYVYGASQTQVKVDGLSPASGYSRQTTYDSYGRTTEERDAAGKPTAYSWEGAGDLLASRTDPAGRKTVFRYDSTTSLTDVFGPAPADPARGCFPAGLAADDNPCAMPHSRTDYDGGVAGLAAAYWPDPTFSGPPRLHRTVGSGGGAFTADWAVSPPAAALGTAAWSARLMGEVVFGADAAYDFALAGSGARRLWVDDRLVADGGTVAGGAGSRHRVMVQYAASASPALELRWRPAGSGAYTAVPAANLSPAYGLPTRAAVDDAAAGSPAQVTAVGYARPETGLPTTAAVDPDGANLATTTAYEGSGGGQFLRPLSRTLPAGDTANPDAATRYAYHGPTGGAPATGCAGVAADQGGLLRSRSAPSADGSAGSVRVEEFAYDAWGRVVATRVVGDAAWTCLAYDDRDRLTSRAIPATLAGTSPRTVTYDHAVGGDPRVVSVGDGTPGTSPIMTTLDLLGRVDRYEDAWAYATDYHYDRPGRLVKTTGRAGTLETGYDDAGRVTTQALDGTVAAAPAYDAAGELASVADGNGTSLASVMRDDAGRVKGLTFNQRPPPLGGLAAPLTSDLVVRSQSGRALSQTVDGAASPTSTFAYDAVGRLTGATVPGQTLVYTFEAPTGCGAPAGAGRNTNRVASCKNGVLTTYAYDGADRLTGSSDPAVGAPQYDAHGNTTVLGAQAMAYDSADRHVRTVAGPTTVDYVRDAADRIVSRSDGSAAVRYGHSGPGDASAFTTDALGLLTQERTLSLVGGVLLTKRAPSDLSPATKASATKTESLCLPWGDSADTMLATLLKKDIAGCHRNACLSLCLFRTAKPSLLRSRTRLIRTRNCLKSWEFPEQRVRSALRSHFL